MTLPFPRAAPGPAFGFAVTHADHDPQAAGPTLRLHTTITETTGTRVHALALRAQIRLEPAARRYSPDQQERLVELFGDPSRWGRTLNPMQLATVSTVTPSFSGEQEVVFEVPLTFDTDVATTRYFRGVGDEGDAPMRLLFSGTVFYEAPSGVQIGLVPWHSEATFRLPVAVWTDMMDAHQHGMAWLRLPSTRSPSSAPGARRGRCPPGSRRSRPCSPRQVTSHERRTPSTPWPRSPTPSCSRATCSTPTAPRRRRTRCAGSSACSCRRRCRRPSPSPRPAAPSA